MISMETEIFTNQLNPKYTHGCAFVAYMDIESHFGSFQSDKTHCIADHKIISFLVQGLRK